MDDRSHRCPRRRKSRPIPSGICARSTTHEDAPHRAEPPRRLGGRTFRRRVGDRRPASASAAAERVSVGGMRPGVGCRSVREPWHPAPSSSIVGGRGSCSASTT
jgi:hypothetical protein